MPGKLTRTALYGEAAENSGLPRAGVAKAVDAFLEAVKAALRRGERVELRRFGTFWPRRWAGRAVRPPGKRKGIRVPEGRTVHFRPGEGLRAMRSKV